MHVLFSSVTLSASTGFSVQASGSYSSACCLLSFTSAPAAPAALPPMSAIKVTKAIMKIQPPAAQLIAAPKTKAAPQPQAARNSNSEKRRYRESLDELESTIVNITARGDWHKCECLVVSLDPSADRRIAHAAGDAFEHASAAQVIVGRYYRMGEINDFDGNLLSIVWRQEPADPDAVNNEELWLYRPYECHMWMFCPTLDLAYRGDPCAIASVSISSDPGMAAYAPGVDLHIPYDAKRPLTKSLEGDDTVALIVVESYQDYAERIVAELENSLEEAEEERQAAVADSSDGGGKGDKGGGGDGEGDDPKGKGKGKGKSQGGWMQRCAKLSAYSRRKDWSNEEGFNGHLARKYPKYAELVEWWTKRGPPHHIT